jgi:hypothetical protein
LAGLTFWRFLSLSAGAQLIIEGFRAGSKTLATGIRVPQIVFWVVLAISLWRLGKYTQSTPDPEASG